MSPSLAPLRRLGSRLVSTMVDMSLAEPALEAPSQTGYAQAKPFSSIPGPRPLPLIGNLLDYRFGSYPLQRCHDLIVERYRQYGPLVREKILGRSFVRVFDPEDVKTIFQNDGKYPMIRPLQEPVRTYRKMRRFSLGLGNVNGEDWYRLRSSVQQAMLRPPSVAVYLPSVEQVAADLISYIRRNRQPDTMEMHGFKKVVSKWSLESSGRIVFEKKLGALNGGENEAWADKLIDSNAEMFHHAGILKFSVPFHNWLPTPKWVRLVKVEDFVYGESRRLIQETMNNVLKSKDSQKYAFMRYLMSKKDLTKEDMFILSHSMVGDTLNTTGPMLIYNLYNLAANPQCQERLYKEVCEHVPRNGQIDGAVLNKMSYLKACVKETFRLFPIGTELSRILQKDLVLSGYHVPAGTPCDMNMGLLLMTDVYFQQPKAFIPERWLREEKECGTAAQMHPFLLLPFGHGPRMCVGRRFSEQDLYVALSRLIQNFKVTYQHGEIGQYYKTLLLPDGCAHFTFEDRA